MSRLSSCLVVATLLALWTVTPASADRGFGSRFSANDAGDITFISNTLMSCPVANAQCLTARNGTNPTDSNLNNNAFSMGYVNTAPDATSFNSSSADLDLPAGATVLFAGLYYGADYSAGVGGSTAPSTGTAARRVVRFRAPGDLAYNTLTAPVIDDSALNIGRYQGFVNVTDRVKAAGDGTYSVADVQAGTGQDRYAGWSLVVAYRDSTQPPRNLTVTDGLVTIRSNDPPTSIPVSGFTTPPAGAVRSTVGFIAYEGDLGLLGDSASLITSKGAFTLTNAANPATNYFNSSISLLGSPFTNKSPNFLNQLGYDADLLDANGLLGNGDTSATIRVTTVQDQYLPGVVTFSTELYAPVVIPTKSVANVTHPTGPNRPGDTLRYTVNYTNTGQDQANNFVLRDPIPANASYVPGSMRITGGPNAPAAPTDAPGDDLGEFNIANDFVRFRLGTGATPTHGGQLGLPGSGANSVTITFDVRVDPDAPGGTEIVNAAFADFTGNTLGTPFVDQKTPPVTTIVRRPDLTLSKSHTVPFVGGTTTTFKLIARNVGTVSTEGLVTVKDTFPGPGASGFDAIHDGGGVGWNCSIAGMTLTCTRSDALAPGESYPAITVDADVHDPPLPTIVNQAVVSGGGDDTPENNTATDSGGATAQADVMITKTATPASLASGDIVTYTLLVRNNGPSNAQNVTVDDPLPGATYANVVATPSQGTCTAAVTCNLGSIARNHTATITITATVLANDTTLTNTATVASTTTDPNPGNNTDTAEVDVANTADVAIDKTGAPLAPQVGSSFTYTLTVTNNGPGQATGLEVIDDLPAGIQTPVVTADPGWTCNAPAEGGTLQCTRPTLDNGASSQIQVTGTIGASLGGTYFTNGASVTTESTDPDTSDNTDSTTHIALPAADLSLTKTFSTNLRVNTGAAVSFELVVTNNGPSDATGVVVSDPLPAGLAFVSSSDPACTFAGGEVTCNVGALANGATFTVTINVTVTAPGSANIVNTATVDGIQPDPIPTNNSDTDRLIVNAAADVAVDKTAPPTAAVGDDITYSITATNNGPDTANAVVITDQVPAGTTFVSASAPCTQAAGLVTCPLGNLTNGASQTVTITVTVGASLAGQAFDNTATVDTTTFDPDDSNDTDTGTVIVDPLADLEVVKTASTLTPRPNQDVTYTLTVTNHGPNDATGVAVTDTLPAGVDLITLDPRCDEAAGIVTCQIGDLAAGDSTELLITVQTTFVNAGTTATNTAVVDGNEVDPDTTNNTSHVDIDVQQQIDLRITKRSSNATPAVGESFTYTLAVFNAGPSDATNVVVTDPLAAGLVFESASPGCTFAAGTVTCALGTVAALTRTTVTITVHATATLADQTVTNGAVVGGDQPEENPDNNEDETDVDVGPLVDLSVVKTATDTTPVTGGTVNYVLTVTNAGPSTATGVVLTDTLPAGLTLVSATPSQGSCADTTCNLGSIAAGGSAQVTIVATVTADVGSAITNVGSVTSGEPDSNPGNNTDTELITVDPGPVPPAPELQIIKRVDQKQVTVGDELRYLIIVRNVGDGYADNVVMTDTFDGPVEIVKVHTTVGSCDGKNPLTCDIGRMSPHSGARISVIARVTAAGEITNRASTIGDGSESPEEDEAGAVAGDVSTKLRVHKEALSTSVQSGDLVKFRVSVRNVGEAAATNVRVCDTLPRGLSYVSSSPSGSFANGQLCWKIKRLKQGAKRRYVVTARAQNVDSGKRVVNRVTVRSDNAPRANDDAGVRIRPVPVVPGGVTG